MSLRGEIFDYPTRVLVNSEEKPEEVYLVDLTALPRGIDHDGYMQFNGSCQCKDFIYRCLPKLKIPENKGMICRCKHLRYAREHALSFILPELKKADPNTDEDTQT